MLFSCENTPITLSPLEKEKKKKEKEERTC